jgi:hypothetical protein
MKIYPGIGRYQEEKKELARNRNERLWEGKETVTPEKEQEQNVYAYLQSKYLLATMQIFASVASIRKGGEHVPHMTRSGVMHDMLQSSPEVGRGRSMNTAQMKLSSTCFNSVTLSCSIPWCSCSVILSK